MALDEIPEEFRAGQTFDVILSFVAYPGDDWDATLKLRPQDGGLPADVPAVAAPDPLAFLFNVDESITALWPAAFYTYLIEVTDGTDVIIAEEGQIEVLPTAANITGDQRTHAQITLSNIEAVIEGKATKDQQSYQIHDRALTRYTWDELLELRRQYRNEVARENSGGGQLQRKPISFGPC